MNGTDLKKQFRDAECTPEEAEQLCAIARQGRTPMRTRELLYGALPSSGGNP